MAKRENIRKSLCYGQFDKKDRSCACICAVSVACEGYAKGLANGTLKNGYKTHATDKQREVKIIDHILDKFKKEFGPPTVKEIINEEMGGVFIGYYFNENVRLVRIVESPKGDVSFHWLGSKKAIGVSYDDSIDEYEEAAKKTMKMAKRPFKAKKK